MKYCRKFKLMLVRPSLTDELSNKLAFIKEKLLVELMPNASNQEHSLRN